MAKDEVYNLRWDSELKSQVQKYAKDHGYEDVASFIRETLREKLKSDTEEEHLEKIIVKMFQNQEFRRSLGLK
jgi:hypothetical protein